ncbi:hypothetical protein [Aerolutibacter ruishenii]|uniref:Uncharacterized protein n=1 Tax=Aerolutibacter ruishenii TaxID=686800 RepID=A0A562M1H2_9GAMM|nr:hypothetical protein [Lysobacter ruishenii]TWI13451.1 hypothetical protein IP93_00613 [Lysobacter ruishenii]
MSVTATLLAAYPAIATVHACIGAVALGAFWAAAFLRKGSPLHRRVGQVYLLAMTGILLTGAAMALGKALQGHVVASSFLGYLLLITAAAVWSSWRAVRDKSDVARYTGPVYVSLGAASFLAGAGVLALGLQKEAPLLVGFSIVGLAVGVDMLRKRLRRAQLARHPLWWRTEHYTAMLGNAVATHIAFLIIGLPKLLPSVGASGLYYAAWFGPLAAAAVAKVWLDRRHRLPPRAVARRGGATAHATHAVPR